MTPRLVLDVLSYCPDWEYYVCRSTSGEIRRIAVVPHGEVVGLDPTSIVGKRVSVDRFTVSRSVGFDLKIEGDVGSITTNHKEALELAHLTHEKSNLARAYLDLREVAKAALEAHDDTTLAVLTSVVCDPESTGGWRGAGEIAVDTRP